MKRCSVCLSSNVSTLLCDSHTKIPKCIISFYYSHLYCFRSWKRPFWRTEQKILEVLFCKNWLWGFCVDALEIMTFQLLITRCFCAVYLGRNVRWPWFYIQYFLLVVTQSGWNAGSIHGKEVTFLSVFYAELTVCCFWHVCFAYWVTISICSMYIVVMLFWQKVLKIKMWYDSQQGLINLESLWHPEIFSWNPVFSRAFLPVIHFSFLKIPP